MRLATFTACVLVVVCHLLFASVVLGDANSIIARTEKVAKPKRVLAYELALDDRKLLQADRLALTKSFAEHALKLSPAFGPSNPRIDATKWVSFLKAARELDSNDKTIQQALCALLIDLQQIEAALPVAKDFLKSSPNSHEAQAWLAWCESHAAPEGDNKTQSRESWEFPLHFVRMTNNSSAKTRISREQCLQEVEILNRQFRPVKRPPQVQFVFKSFSDSAPTSNGGLARFVDVAADHDSESFAKAYNDCKDPSQRDESAINVYITDTYSKKYKFQDQTSHGVRNSNRPYLLIDWERLGGKTQNVEAHEMGHAFGLGHVGVPGAVESTATNLMTSVEEEFGSGGQRNLGFTDSQYAIVLHHARRTSQRLGLAR